MRVGVICADERMLYAAGALSASMEVVRIQRQSDLLALPQLSALLLPVKGSDEDGNVEMDGERLHIPSRFWHIQGKELLVCSGTRIRPKACQARWSCYMEDEEVVEQNAVLTAEGVLYELIRCTSKSIYALQVDIVGYGHCGRAIYEMLKNLHVDVRVIRRREDGRKNFLTHAQWSQCGDVIIHTATGKVIRDEDFDRWTKRPIILDVATPCFFSKELLQKKQIVYRRIANLPGRFACSSAGAILADHVRRKLSAEK